MVQSIQRALSILEILAEGRQDVSLGEISKRSQLHPSTAHRIVKTLVASGFVQQNSDNSKYRLGPVMLRMAGAARASSQLVRVAHPWLQQLAHETGETINLSALDGEFGVILDRIEPANPLRYTINIGTRIPLHATAAGKVLLAALPLAGVKRIVAANGLPALTPHTITSLSKLTHELAKVRRTGVAYDFEERDLDVRCIATAVRDDMDTVIAAINIAGPSNRMSKTRLQKLAPLLIHSARAISEALGNCSKHNASPHERVRS